MCGEKFSSNERLSEYPFNLQILIITFSNFQEDFFTRVFIDFSSQILCVEIHTKILLNMTQLIGYPNLQNVGGCGAFFGGSLFYAILKT